MSKFIALSSLALVLNANLVYADPLEADAMLLAHNEWRAKEGVAPMAWSMTLQDKASQWAAHLQTTNACGMKHSGAGENLYWASPQKTANAKDAQGHWIWQNSLQAIKPADVVASWGSEKQWYNYATNQCNAPAGKACGHYTQVVWRASTEVGCAKAVCADFSQVWVCNYAPAGNVVGQKPY